MARSGVLHGLHYLDDFLFLGNPGIRRMRAQLSNRVVVLQFSGPSRGSAQGRRTVVDPCISWHRDRHCKRHLTIAGRQIAALTPLPAAFDLSARLYKATAPVSRHAATVVRPGRSFTRRLIDLSTSTAQLDSKLRLNRDARADLAWWYAFVGDWNGVSLLSSLRTQTHTIRVQSDASGLWGCGAVIVSSSPPRCFSYQWSHAWMKKSIAPKEMFPVLAAACLWGAEWRGQTILIESDNTTVVAAVGSGASHDESLMPLLRTLQYVMAKGGFVMRARHIPGNLNTFADALSRGHPLTAFISSSQALVDLPRPLIYFLDHLLLAAPDWTSEDWRRQLGDILRPP